MHYNIFYIISSSILAVYFFVLNEIIKIMLIISIEKVRAGVEYKTLGEKVTPEEKVGKETPKKRKNSFVNKTLNNP